jgi:hypothetical protein
VPYATSRTAPSGNRSRMVSDAGIVSVTLAPLSLAPTEHWYERALVSEVENDPRDERHEHQRPYSISARKLARAWLGRGLLAHGLDAQDGLVLALRRLGS